jgi:hypothetical protein
MRTIPFWFGIVGLIIASGCASGPGTTQITAKGAKSIVVDAGCGQCLLGLKGEKKGCDLAVRIDGKSYFVDGFKMSDFGDAHADDGMCNATHQAKVTGEIVNGRFVASSLKLLPVEKHN